MFESYTEQIPVYHVNLIRLVSISWSLFLTYAYIKCFIENDLPGHFIVIISCLVTSYLTMFAIYSAAYSYPIVSPLMGILFFYIYHITDMKFFGSFYV